MKKKKISCKCNKEITANTWKPHLKSKKCNLPGNEKDRILSILNLKTKYQFAWKKEDGQEALAEKLWYVSLIKNETNIENWRFSSPRTLGENRPSVYAENSRNRVGSLNPMVKSKKFDFSKNDVIEFGRNAFHDLFLKDTYMSEGKFYKLINERFPHFSYLFADENIGIGNKRKSIILRFSGLNEKELNDLYIKRRGRCISRGLKNSEHAINTARKLAGNLLKRRMSEPHKLLFSMLKTVDKSVEVEKSININGKYYYYDIFSNNNNIYFEMHGRFWHDLNGIKNTNNEKIKKIIERNVENDKIKEALAISQGKFYIFWDDEIKEWKNKIREIYGKYPAETKKIKNLFDKKSRRAQRL